MNKEFPIWVVIKAGYCIAWLIVLIITFEAILISDDILMFKSLAFYNNLLLVILFLFNWFQEVRKYEEIK